jgi:hypothetical protein
LIAAKMPAGTPSTMAKMIAQIDSSRVAGNSSQNWSSTGFLVTIEVPKSPRSTTPEVIEILDDDRPVEAELSGDLGMALRRHDALAGKQRDRIAGQQSDEREGDDRDPDEGRDQHGEPSEQKPEHVEPLRAECSEQSVSWPAQKVHCGRL